MSGNSDHDESKMDDTERAFHFTMKPSWGPDGTLVYAAPPHKESVSFHSRASRENEGLLVIRKGAVTSESRDIHFASFSKEPSDALTKQKSMTTIVESHGVPFATLPESFKYIDLFNDRNKRDPASNHEKLVWELASLLFDPIEVPTELQEIEHASYLLRKDSLSSFWRRLVEHSSTQHVALAKSSEEKAIACLSGHRVSEACGHLLNGKDFHLAALVSLIGGNEKMGRAIHEQLKRMAEIKSPF